MNDELIKLVKEKIYFTPRAKLSKYAYEKNIIGIKTMNKDEIISAILYKLDEATAVELTNLFKDCIGFNAGEIESKLNITKSERQKWTKSGLLSVSGTYQTRAYGKYLDCPIYDVFQILSITQDMISDWRTSIKPLTEKQKAGKHKAKETALKNKTCIICDHIESNKKDLDNGWCWRCINRKTAYDRRRYWLEHKNDFVILDTETTGLEYTDEIIDIAIIDLDGQILLNTLVFTAQNISDEALRVHGISYGDLIKNNAPTWEELYPQIQEILKNKTVIAYNSDFDERMIHQTCHTYNLKNIETNYECLMHNVMTEWSSESYIKLADVVDTPQSHRALGDCYLCLEVINSNTILQEVANA